MTDIDIRTSLADEIRRRAESERSLAAQREKEAAEKHELAQVLDLLAARLACGTLDDKIGELLHAARPLPSGPRYHLTDEKSEINCLRRLLATTC
jgi:hypothetical protein